MDATDRVQKEYASRGGDREAFPWATIIDAVVKILPAICPASRAKKWAKRHPEAAKAAIADALKQSGVKGAANDSDLIDSTYAAFLKLSDDEIEELKNA